MALSSEHMPGPWPDENGEEGDFCSCLERIDLLFQRDYLQKVGVPPASIQPFFLPEDDIALRLSYPQGQPFWLDMPGIYLPDAREALNRRLQALVTAFDLTSCERDILLAGLLPRLSDHYIRLPDSGLRGSISPRLLSRLFAGTQTEARLLQSALHPSSPLFQFHLLAEEKPGGNRPATSDLVVSESLWHYLCGEGSAVVWYYPFTRWVKPDDAATYSSSLYEQLFRLCLSHDKEAAPVVVLEGHEQDGRERLLATILAQYDYALLSLNVEALTELSAPQQRKAMAEIVREARLHHAGLVLECCSGSAAAQNAGLRTLELLLAQVKLPLFILTEKSADLPLFAEAAVVHLAMPQPTAAQKVALLQAAWPTRAGGREQRALSTLVQRYAFNPADVPLLMQEADYYRQLRGDGVALTTEDLRQTLARRSRKNFGKLARRITPARTPEDIILAPALKTQLDEILAAIRLRESVAEKHFSHKLGGNTGLSALFYGDSGTGKTLAAEVLAQQLEVDLIKVDLSSVVNKYVGETEKNLSRIFDLAQADSGVLFFDEADALFGKRSETKDAHDRHANIEVSYLLQRLENYPGLVILATNNRSHLDSAFNRRFTFITRFTYPDVALRRQMWQSAWPATLALADDVDYEVLAAGSELTGANIRNVALLAAVLAAEEGSKKIHLHHIKHAISRELGKLGRLSF